MVGGSKGGMDFGSGGGGGMARMRDVPWYTVWGFPWPDSHDSAVSQRNTGGGMYDAYLRAC